MSEKVIDCRAVGKVFGKGENAYHALRGVDFSVSKGELVMLSGPSGSGKTTLLSIIGCTLDSSAGSVSLMGRDMVPLSEDERSKTRLMTLGFIFQSHNLIESLTAAENVALVLCMKGWDRNAAESEAVRLLDSVNLHGKSASKPRELSGGQKQRVAVARALAGRPPILLADEPTAALDAQNGLAVTETLRKLAKENGHTVVVVTHDSRIFHLADRIVRIEDGRIKETEHDH